MFKIEYKIKLNESGRPCVYLPKEYEDNAEDKFFVLELSRYLLMNVYNRRSAEFDTNTTNKLNDCIAVLGQVSDEVALLLREQMEAMAEISVTINKNYHILVENIEERNKLKYYNIVYNDKIFVRQEGLRVLVLENMKIYELQGGIDDEYWNEVG